MNCRLVLILISLILSRSSGETCVMYCAKLKSLLTMYVESRKVKDADALLSLIVCDRVKSVLNEGCLRHVLSVEAAAADGWLRADKLAEIVDTYMANHFSNDRPRASAIGTAQQVGVDVERTAGKPPPRPPPPTFPQPTLQPQSQRRDTGLYRPQAGANFRPPNALNTNITCYKCKGFGHTRKFCPSLSHNFNNQGQRNERRVNACSKQVARPKPTCDESIAVSKDQDASVTMSSLECMIVEHLSSNAVECNSVNQGDNVDKQSYVNDYDAYRDFVSLQYVNVSIDEH